MSSTKIPKPLRSFLKQSHQKVKKWFSFDPEFESYLPKHHLQYRGVSPASQPDAIVPKIRDIDQFYGVAHDIDLTYNEDAYRRNFEIFYRYQMLENPLKLLPGQPVGPFYDMGRPNEIAVGDVDYRPQVYTYRRKKVDRVLEKYTETIKKESNTGKERILKELMQASTESQVERIQKEKELLQQLSEAQKKAAEEKRKEKRKSRILIAVQPDASRLLSRVPVKAQESI